MVLCFMFVYKDIIKNYAKLTKLCKGHDMMAFTEFKVQYVSIKYVQFVI